MNLKDFFEQHHKGKGKAIKRRELLMFLRRKVNPNMTDRKMRKEYESLPLCGTEKGLFLPVSEEEKRKQIDLINEKIDRCKEEIARLIKYDVNGRLF